MTGLGDECIEWTPEDSLRDRIRPLWRVMIRNETRPRVDNNVAFTVTAVSAEPAEEGVGSRASGGRVSVADEDLHIGALGRMARR